MSLFDRWYREEILEPYFVFAVYFLIYDSMPFYLIPIYFEQNKATPLVVISTTKIMIMINKR